jgi:hypothetical protein
VESGFAFHPSLFSSRPETLFARRFVAKKNSPTLKASVLRPQDGDFLVDAPAFHFLFCDRLVNLLSLTVGSTPNLGQEIAVVVAVKNQLP